MGPTMTFLLRQLETLRHANIVKLLGYCLGNDNSLVAIVYDKLRGGDLETALREGTLNRHPYKWSSLLEIALGTAKGLCYRHEHQYNSSLHSEITTRNIFLDSGTRAHIAVTVDVSALDLQQTSNQISHSIYRLVAPMGQMPTASGFYCYSCSQAVGRWTSTRHTSSLGSMKPCLWRRMFITFLMLLWLMRLTKAFNQMWDVVKLAARCTAERADSRPSIEKVLWSLLQVQKAVNSKVPVRLAAISDHCN